MSIDRRGRFQDIPKDKLIDFIIYYENDCGKLFTENMELKKSLDNIRKVVRAESRPIEGGNMTLNKIKEGD